MSVTIETPLVDVLKEIQATQKELLNAIVDLKVAMAKLENTPREIQELKTTQKNQVWALISLLGVAVVGTVIREFLSAPKL